MQRWFTINEMTRMVKGVVALLLGLGLLSGCGASSVKPSPKPSGAILQIRRLLGTEPSCQGWKAEPPAGQFAVVRVLGQSRQCYRVGVSDVSLRGLGATVVNELGNWVVKFQMDHAQSPAFNGMAVRDYRRTVAWVVDGQALGQATVLARSFGGSFQISGYPTKDSAERIVRQLDPG